jgi:UDP-glucose 4-epimerase
MSVRVVVTGGAGFIGSHVVDALVANGDEVVVVDDLSRGRRERVQSDATLRVHDVREPLGDLAVGADAVVHLAAQADVRVSVAEPARDAAINVVGTAQVLEAAREAGARVVFASTGGAIYGECERPAREDDPGEPLSPYGAAKLAAEGYLATFSRLTGTPHVSLRFGNVYGPRQDPHGEAGVIAIFLGRLRDGQPCHVFGDGTQERDYVYVGDVVQAVRAALDRREPGVFNVGTGVATSVVDLLEACRTAARRGGEPVFEPPREGELQRSVLDPDLAARTLGFRAETPLHDGIAATWDWIRREGEE